MVDGAVVYILPAHVAERCGWRTVVLMDDPIYIRQTFEPEHVESRDAAQEWFSNCWREAKSKGAGWHRMSVAEGNDGLLYEAWDARPSDEGEPRWSLVETEWRA